MLGSGSLLLHSPLRSSRKKLGLLRCCFPEPGGRGCPGLGRGRQVPAASSWPQGCARGEAGGWGSNRWWRRKGLKGGASRRQGWGCTEKQGGGGRRGGGGRGEGQVVGRGCAAVEVGEGGGGGGGERDARPGRCGGGAGGGGEDGQARSLGTKEAAHPTPPPGRRRRPTTRLLGG